MPARLVRGRLGFSTPIPDRILVERMSTHSGQESLALRRSPRPGIGPDMGRVPRLSVLSHRPRDSTVQGTQYAFGGLTVP